MLAALTNEDPVNLNIISLFYLKNILIGSTIAPLNWKTYWIGHPGIYFVKGLFDDPLNSYLAYLFVTDKNLNQGTFGVFKLNFDPAVLKYVYTILSMSSGSTFSVNTIKRTSQTDANDFFFAGKA